MPSITIDAAGGGRLLDGSATATWARGRTRNDERWLETSPVPPHDPTTEGSGLPALVALLGALAERARSDGCTAVHWESDDPPAPVDAIAAAVGLDRHRDILQLRRPLPLEPDLVADTPMARLRPLRSGTADEEAWVRVNNRSFATHPDQGRESVASLRATMAEPWFDPGGLLLAESEPGVDAGGDLDGFCWTRVHPAVGGETALGEIYVIGIDPRAGGRGLGRTLTVAGLIHLAGVGLGAAMLFVDADNAPARRLYRRLGFATHHTRRVRSRSFD